MLKLSQFKLKRLDTFLLQRFLPVLAMTFCICMFIVMMQFLWRFIEDLVGKGLSFRVIAELFWYAALTMVPTALPLAILLASLMTFGNLGEKFELTAIKSAGISLYRIMAPLIILMVMIAIGAFFFQNDVLPVAQTKMYTLIFSMKQKSPEVEIPERSFYDQVPGMNLYVDRKNQQTGVLHGMIIYDAGRGMDNARIILADSGKIAFTEDKSHLFLHLFKGELFENFNSSTGVQTRGYMPFRRESFNEKKVFIAFDANFNRIDEQGIRSQYVGMNISQLSEAIDSLQEQVDSIGREYGEEMKETPLVGVPYYQNVFRGGQMVKEPQRAVHPKQKIDIDSVFNAPNPGMAKSYLTGAQAKIKQRRAEYEFKSLALTEHKKLMRRHDIEMQRKFTLSLACLIFFFIGAPLGAIIKKGGIGTPLVISVFLFVIYFIFDNMGYKFARDGKLAVWEGIWLSSMVMLPLGIFFTYKAVGDSSVFDFDAYKRFFHRVLGISDRRYVKMKEIVLEPVVPAELAAEVKAFLTPMDERAQRMRHRFVLRRWFSSTCTHAQEEQFDDMVNHLSYSSDKRIISLLNRLPMVPNRRNVSSVLATCRQILNILEPAKVEAEAAPDDNNSETIDATDSAVADSKNNDNNEH